MRKEVQVYLLHFTSPLHLGNARSDYGSSLKTLASDGLYAALTACLAKYGRTIPANGELGCTISSLFPFYQAEHGEPIFLFPKPLATKISDNVKATEVKVLKQVKWLDKESFCAILQGNTLPADTTHIYGNYLSSRKIEKNFMISQVVQHVMVKSRSPQSGDIEAPQPFYMDRILFSSESGLYFMVEGDTTRLEEALALLAMEGIGTDRNVGNGFFEYEKRILSLEIPDSANHILSLSSFIPTDENELITSLKGRRVAYELERRGGWICDAGVTLRRNVIHLFAAGSVFYVENVSGISVMGKIVDLRPADSSCSHPVWRNGKTLCLPLKIV